MDSNTNRSGVIDTTSGIMEVDWVRVWTMEGETVRVPQAITLGQSSITVPVGTYVWVSQSITPSNAQDQGTTWTSSNDAIARTGNGWVHGQSVGSCVVTARTWNGVQATLNVTVS
jgi:beta-fructofuranosidase